jgi:diguanylate cyclase (GGDEF)-like protein
MKAIHRSALIIIVTRFLFAGFFAFLNLWGLTALAFIGGVVWIFNFVSTRDGYRNLPFYLSIFESIVFTVITVLSIGWDSGVYFILVLLLLIIMVNGKLNKSLRFIICCLVVSLLAVLFIVSNVLNLCGSLPSLPENISLLLNMLSSAVALLIIVYSTETDKMIAESEILDTNQKLIALANTDPLTNLLNRRVMLSQIEKEKEQVDLGGQPFSLIMIDVDDFKQINDIYGHDGGDLVLHKLSELIRMSVRSHDLISRWGGDEFLIMLLETDLSRAETIAEKIRLRVINSPFVFHEIDIPVTITLGVSLCDKYSGIGNSLRKADLALYKGKQEGKNKSVGVKLLFL